MTTPTNKLIEEAVEELENLVQWETPEHEEEVKHWLRNTLTKHEDAVLERSAVAVWSHWAEDSTPLENTERSRAFSEATKVIRSLKSTTDPLQANQSDHEQTN